MTAHDGPDVTDHDVRSGDRRGSGIVQQLARVVSNEAAGVYRHLVLDARAVAASAQPGQFVACAVGEPDGTGALLLRRAFSLHRADPDAGTVEIVVAPHNPGTRWIAEREPGRYIDVVGPCGHGFSDPPEPVRSVVLVGGGYGVAPLEWFAQRLRAAGLRADIVSGAADSARLFAEPAAGPAGLGGTVVVTEDGSSGHAGRVTEVLPELLATGAGVVYACGPMPMLRAVHEVAAAHGVASQLAVEESMACGIGVCMTCVMPVVGEDGRTRMTRSCVEGPVFAGDRLRWDAIVTARGKTSSSVPDDCEGAPIKALGE